MVMDFQSNYCALIDLQGKDTQMTTSAVNSEVVLVVVV